MKKYKWMISVLLLFVVISAVSFPVQAEDHSDEPYVITAYHVDIDVGIDNVLHITEEIDVRFHEARHGIYRTIPIKNKVVRADGSTAVTRAKIRDISCSEDYKKSRQSSNLILRIGDPDVTVTGDRHYTISYDYALGQDVAEGYDELYFNVIGSSWDTYIDLVSFSITMPKEFDSPVGFSTGGYGSAGTDIVQYVVDGMEIEGYLTQGLAPYEALTVRIELEEGYFYFNHLAHSMILSSMVILPLALLIAAVFLWAKYGRDRKVIKTVEFYPPSGMNSAEVAYWYKGRLPKKDSIALLIELANEGYLIIHDENSGKKRRKAQYSIERVKLYPDGLDENKKIFFEGLFESGKDIVTGEDLKNKFYHTIDKIRTYYHSSDKIGRIYARTSARLRTLCRVLAVLCLILDVVIFNSMLGGDERILPLGIGIAILAAVFLMSHFIARRTEESHKNLEKLSGFRMFLKTAEKDRLEALVHDDPKYFYHILPFAYVLGVSNKWVKKFEGIAVEPPEWYTSAGVFTVAAMWYTMNQTIRSASSEMTSSPIEVSSGGGSGGGGGVSGGGSGGGGGGSW